MKTRLTTNIKTTRHALVNGKAKYARLFIRFRTPEETLSFKPVKDGEDFAQRLGIIADWYDAHVKDKNVLLKFEVMQCNNDGDEIEEEDDDPTD